MEKKKQLGELFVEAGMITQRKLEETLALQKQGGSDIKIGELLLQRGLISKQQLGEILEFYFNVAFVDLARLSIPNEMISLVPITVAKHNKLVPVKVENGNCSSPWMTRTISLPSKTSTYCKDGSRPAAFI
jgi:type IV pilus assembly protein PilB